MIVISVDISGGKDLRGVVSFGPKDEVEPF
jgi:hypothetical protein